MNNYRIRIDEVEGMNIPDLLSITEPKCYVIVRHELPTGNPHYHAYIQTDVKDGNFRKRLKAKFTQLKKTDYSIKNCDVERINEYVQYMFNTKHGNRWELVDKFGFSDSVIDGLMEAAKEVSDDYRKTREQKKHTGVTLWDIAEEIRQEFDKRLVLGEDYDQKRIIAYTDIAIDVLRKNKKVYDEFLLRKVITTAMGTDAKGRETLRHKMLKTFSQI